MNIPFFNYQSLFKENEKKFIEIFSDIGRRGAYIMQDDLSKFESKIEEYTGIKHAIGVANATDAIQLLLKAGGIGIGDEVIFCSHTMVATASAIAFTGATPIPVEAGPDHLIDTESIIKAITPRTKAIIPTQLNGRVANMDKILDIAKEYGLQIYEDSAQALGAKYKGQCAGSFGLGGCISFYPAKTLGCFGDGGMVLTDDPDLAQKIKRLADYGQTERHVHTEIGYNSRLDTLQAAVLLAKLPYLPQWTKNRRRAAKWYDRKLSSLSVTRPATAAGAEPVYHLYAVLVEDRDDCLSWLRDRGVMAQVHYHGLIHLQECYNHLGYKVGNFPVAEKIHKHSLSLPLYPEITEQQINRVVDVLGRFPAFK